MIPFAWYLSAALARRENNLVRAGTDIARARTLSPDSPDIMLLAGTLAGLGGNMAEAERLYRQVVQAAPNSDAGRQAQASLATMHEVEVPAPAAAARAHCAPPDAAAPLKAVPRRRPGPSLSVRAGPRPSPGHRRSVQIEFDRGDDPHLLEGRIAGAAAAFLAGGVAVARPDREIALRGGADAADAAAANRAANCSAPARASSVDFVRSCRA